VFMAKGWASGHRADSERNGGRQNIWAPFSRGALCACFSHTVSLHKISGYASCAAGERRSRRWLVKHLERRKKGEGEDQHGVKKLSSAGGSQLKAATVYEDQLKRRKASNESELMISLWRAKLALGGQPQLINNADVLKERRFRFRSHRDRGFAMRAYPSCSARLGRICVGARVGMRYRCFVSRAARRWRAARPWASE